MIKELNIFDDEGNLRHKQQAKEVIDTSLQLMAELNNEGTRKAAKKIMQHSLIYSTQAVSFHSLTSAPTLFTI